MQNLFYFFILFVNNVLAIEQEERDLIIMKHNNYRSELANGMVSSFIRKASKMNKIEYDVEMENEAIKLIKNYNKLIRKYQRKYGINEIRENNLTIDEIIDLWWNESKNFTSKKKTRCTSFCTDGI